MSESQFLERIPADARYLGAVRSFVAELLSAATSKKETQQVVLALDEALGNVVKHGRGSAPRSIVLQADVGPSGARFSVFDFCGRADVAAIKPVVIGPKYGTFRVIKSGLTADDRVVINGLMRAAPGSKVIPQPTELKVPEDLAAAAANPDDITR